MARIKTVEGVRNMALKSPGIITFMLSVILTVIVLINKVFAANIPLLTAENEFWVLLFAQMLLIFGCIMRGL